MAEKAEMEATSGIESQMSWEEMERLRSEIFLQLK